MGGRLDPTNAIEKPLLAVITAIGYDHQEFLGNTLEEIASEKAGIIKNNCPVVLPFIDLPVLEKTARQKNARIYFGHDVQINVHQFGLTATEFSIKLSVGSTLHNPASPPDFFPVPPDVSYENLALSLLGEHQLENATQVLLSIQALRDAGVAIPDNAVKKGLKNVKWPGRFDIIPGKPTILLDGAHNVNGAERFCRALTLYFPQKPVTLLLGMVQQKDCIGILDALAPVLDRADAVVCTQPSTSRALSAFDLATQIKSKTRIILSPIDALNETKKMAGDDGIVAVAGSLYLIGDIIKTI